MLSHFINIQYCYDYLVNQIPMGLLLYSHLPVALIALIFSTYVLIRSKNLPATLLFGMCMTFVLWCAFDLSAWFSFLGSENTMFVWSGLDYLAVLMFFLGYYFLYTFVTGRDLPIWQKIGGLLVTLPSAYVAFTGLNISYYDLNTCQATEDGSYTIFTYCAEAFFILAAVTFVILHYRKSKDAVQKRKTLLAGVGVLIFLSVFFSASFLVSQLANSNAAMYAYNYLIYGLFGMPVFLIYLGYLIVRYHAFDLKIFGAQALILALVALIGSEFAYVNSLPNRILVAITLVFVGCIGILLIRSVRREIEQRERIEKLAKDLETANARLKELDQMKNEFLSIASHQLRAPITAIRGYAANILDGSYGAVPEPLTEPLTVIQESARLMANSIDDYLNISRIEQGSMKYEKSDFDLAKLATQVVNELCPLAKKRGLTLESKAPEPIMVNADIGKMKQIISNLTDNSIKYTEKGGVTLVAEKVGGTARITISDTGIGIAADEIGGLFTKFTRARDANKVNTTGTGLGLYVAKQLAEGNGGSIRVESDGKDKGSRFIIELPAKA